MRKFPERPFVGVGAIVIGDQGVVLVQRAHEPLKGEWSLPGGVVEVGETLVEAVVREVREETGLDVEVGPVIEVLERIHRDDSGRVEYHYVLIDYLCTAVGGALVPSSDAADVCWAALDAVPSYRLADPAERVIAKGAALAAQL